MRIELQHLHDGIQIRIDPHFLHIRYLRHVHRHRHVQRVFGNRRRIDLYAPVEFDFLVLEVVFLYHIPHGRMERIRDGCHGRSAIGKAYAACRQKSG